MVPGSTGDACKVLQLADDTLSSETVTHKTLYIFSRQLHHLFKCLVRSDVQLDLQLIILSSTNSMMLKCIKKKKKVMWLTYDLSKAEFSRVMNDKLILQKNHTQFYTSLHQMCVVFSYGRCQILIEFYFCQVQLLL